MIIAFRNPYIQTVVLLLLCGGNAWAQPRDTRAQLKGGGRQLSVSPKGRIWLCSGGGTYYTDDIKSGWHYGQVLSNSHPNETSGPRLERISFFNGDTAIITGYIDGPGAEYGMDGIFRTTDGGAHWTLQSYGTSEWIYDACSDAKGRAWMGGSSGKIHYSRDYGVTWEVLKSPYNDATRMKAIFMKEDGVNGLAVALGNGLHGTADNWRSNYKIPTPEDQNKHGKALHFINIEKAVFWKRWMVISQGGRVFYSDTLQVDWKAFPLPLKDFTLDLCNNEIIAVSDERDILRFASPTSFSPLTSTKLPGMPVSMMSVAGVHYLHDDRGQVTVINAKEMYHDGLYTSDQKIEEPRLIKRGSNETWGLAYDQLYLSDNGGADWYREAALPVALEDFYLQSDTTAIFWDGAHTAYRYSLKTHLFTEYIPRLPLTDFLSSHVKTIYLNAGSAGCFHHLENAATLNVEAGTMEVTIDTGSELSVWKAPIDHSVTVQRLSALLATINARPSVLPQLADFRITAKDKAGYRELIAEMIKHGREDWDLQDRINDYTLLESLPDHLDTIGKDVMRGLFTKSEGMWSTTHNWIVIYFINEANDTLKVSNRYYAENRTLHIPWTFSYKGQYFAYYDPELSIFVRDCMPKAFYQRRGFDNKYLLFAIGLYLQPQRQ